MAALTSSTYLGICLYYCLTTCDDRARLRGKKRIHWEPSGPFREKDVHVAECPDGNRPALQGGFGGRMKNAVLTDSARFPFSQDDLDRLSEADVRLVLVEGHSRNELLSVAHSAEAIFVYSAHIDEMVIGRLSKCRLLVRCGSGYDNIDVAAARARGIEVAYVPGYGTDDVAEHALALLMACARRVVSINQEVRRGGWPTYAAIGTMRRLRGATLGLVGFGRIARRLAQMTGGLGMEVIAFDPHVADDAFAAESVRRCTLLELAAQADVISLHASLSPSTTGIVDREFLHRLRPEAILVNTSRGELIDEDALVLSLQQGRLAGAGLDVLEHEPPAPDHPLIALPNVVITSHSAAFTEEALAAVRSQAIDEVLRIFADVQPIHPVPAMLEGESKKCP